MTPFIITEGSDSLSQYPDPEVFKIFLLKATHNERYGIVRLWITEGIPYAFKGNPIMYEHFRDFIAANVYVHSKDVTLVGSGRIGYSLKKKVWGKKFNKTSDLDFSIISNDLFTRLVKDYQKWVADFRTRKILPLHAEQATRWLNAIEEVDKNIPKGYINTRHLFNHGNYPTIKSCNVTMGKLKDRISYTLNAPQISDTSVRVYANWSSCVNQLRGNFYTALDLWGK